jgi:hypothetical protein
MVPGEGELVFNGGFGVCNIVDGLELGDEVDMMVTGRVSYAGRVELPEALQ